MYHMDSSKYTHNDIYRNLLFFVLKYFRQAQKQRNFFGENLTRQKIRKRRRCPTTSLSFVLFTCCCPHLFVSLERNINFVHEFCAWNKIPPVNFWHKIFSLDNVMMKFFHKLFIVEMNANENKANYGIPCTCVNTRAIIISEWGVVWWKVWQLRILFEGVSYYLKALVYHAAYLRAWDNRGNTEGASQRLLL